MNNKQKRKYCADLLLSLSTPFECEVEHRYDFLKQLPTCLYKYRDFDNYSFDMIENNYLYLGAVRELDDPFDCLNDTNYKKYYNKDTGKITPKSIDFLIDHFCPNNYFGKTRKEIRDLAIDCVNAEIVSPELPEDIKGYGTFYLRANQQPFFTMLSDFNNNFHSILKDIKNNGLHMSIESPDDRVGVCALSEVRDNKVMWSLYSNKYEGYCLEYFIPKQKEVYQNLYPVIYTKKRNNTFVLKVLEYLGSSLMRGITYGEATKNVGAITELFHTKDSEWSFQKEWRIIGPASRHCQFLKLKAIYLGFRVSNSNERKILKAAKKLNFSVYKMNKPNGSKKITYCSLFCVKNNY